MSLQRTGRRGGFALIGAVALIVAVSGIGIARIRMNGPLDVRGQTMNEFNADILPPPAFVVEPFLEVALLVDHPESANQRIAKLQSLEKDYRSRVDYWSKSDLDPTLKADLTNGSDVEGARFWTEVDQVLIPAAERGDADALRRSFERLQPIYQAHYSAIQKLVTDTGKARVEVEASAENSMAAVIALLGVLAAALAGMVFYGARWLGRRALDPLAETAAVMAAMAEGRNDTGRTAVHRDDEIGTMTRAIEVFRSAAIAKAEDEVKQRQVVEALSGALGELGTGDLRHRIATPLAPEYEALRASYNGAIEQLESLIESVTKTAQSVSTGAGEIRAASDDLARRNEQQAASLEETSAAMNKVTGLVQETASGASAMQATIAQAHNQATAGGAVVGRAVTAMGAIEKSSSEIGQIINVIDGIAFQTNLLALNAGVEAARAGDAGKGFAVVANEVRALAQRSADAARDIKALITNSSVQVAEGVSLVGETGKMLDDIVLRVAELNTEIGQIASATETQSLNLGSVNSAVNEMDRMTQQNAAMVEQSAAASRSLAEESVEMTRLVAQFATSRSTQSGRGAGADAPINFPAAARRRGGRPMPVVHGNLALKPAPHDDDWSEF